MNRQLFLYCGGEAAVLVVLLEVFQILWFGELRSIMVVNVRETKQLYQRDF